MGLTFLLCLALATLGGYLIGRAYHSGESQRLRDELATEREEKATLARYLRPYLPKPTLTLVRGGKGES